MQRLMPIAICAAVFSGLSGAGCGFSTSSQAPVDPHTVPEPESAPAPRPRPAPEPPPGAEAYGITYGDFTFQTVDGPRSLSSFRPKIVLLYFGYTHCAMGCPIMLGAVQGALAALSEAERKKVHVVFVSFDPARDSPQRVATHLEQFGPGFTGGATPLDDVDRIARDWGITFRKVPVPGSDSYSIEHRPNAFVLSKQGDLAARLGTATSAEKITRALRDTLAGWHRADPIGSGRLPMDTGEGCE